MGVLADHRRLIELIVGIIRLLESNRSVQSVPRLRAMLVDYHKLFLQTLGHRATKIKLHLSHHIADCIQRHSIVLSAFSCEARNRLLKQASPHDSRRSAGFLIARLLVNLEHIIRRARYTPLSLLGKRQAGHIMSKWLEFLPAHPPVISLMGSFGFVRFRSTFKRWQYVYVVFPPQVSPYVPHGGKHLCQIICCLQAVYQQASHSDPFFLAVHICELKGGSVWAKTGFHTCVHHNMVERSVVVCRHGDDVQVLSVDTE